MGRLLGVLTKSRTETASMAPPPANYWSPEVLRARIPAIEPPMGDGIASFTNVTEPGNSGGFGEEDVIVLKNPIPRKQEEPAAMTDDQFNRHSWKDQADERSAPDPQASASTSAGPTTDLTASQPASRPAKITPAGPIRTTETGHSVIARALVIKNASLSTPDETIACFGQIEGVIACAGFVLEKGGVFDGRVIASETVDIFGAVKNGRIVADTVRLWDTADISDDTIIVCKHIGIQLGAKVHAQVIADGALDVSDRLLVVDAPSNYRRRPEAIDGQDIGQSQLAAE